MVVALGTPQWGTGKDGDGALLHMVITVTTTDGRTLLIPAEVGNTSPIGPGHIGFIPINITNFRSISLADVNKINLTVGYDGDRSHWNVRAEVFLTFKDNRVLATGYTEPSTELFFARSRQTWNPFKNGGVARANMFTKQTMFEPVN